MDDQTISILVFLGVAIVVFAIFRKLMSLMFMAAIGFALYYLFAS